MTKVNIRPFTRELRKQGFDFEWRDRSGGTECTQFTKRQGDRRLRVQFWKDGNHRVSHGTYSSEHCYSETTLPTSFKTVEGMLAAVAAEWTRPSREPGTPLDG